MNKHTIKENNVKENLKLAYNAHVLKQTCMWFNLERPSTIFVYYFVAYRSNLPARNDGHKQDVNSNANGIATCRTCRRFITL